LSHTVLFNRWPEDGCLLVLVIWGIYFFHAWILNMWIVF
jgi:hypothetical protein